MPSPWRRGTPNGRWPRPRTTPSEPAAERRSGARARDGVCRRARACQTPSEHGGRRTDGHTSHSSQAQGAAAAGCGRRASTCAAAVIHCRHRITSVTPTITASTATRQAAKSSCSVAPSAAPASAAVSTPRGGRRQRRAQPHQCLCHLPLRRAAPLPAPPAPPAPAPCSPRSTGRPAASGPLARGRRQRAPQQEPRPQPQQRHRPRQPRMQRWRLRWWQIGCQRQQPAPRRAAAGLRGAAAGRCAAAWRRGGGAGWGGAHEWGPPARTSKDMRPPAARTHHASAGNMTCACAHTSTASRRLPCIHSSATSRRRAAGEPGDTGISSRSCLCASADCGSARASASVSAPCRAGAAA